MASASVQVISIIATDVICGRTNLKPAQTGNAGTLETTVLGRINEMQKLKFEGYSDDTFGEYSHFNVDYDNCADGSVIAWRLTERKSMDSDDDVSGMIVCGQYSGSSWPDGMESTWLIGIQPIEDLPLPPWALQFGRDDYWTSLEIDVPDEVVLHFECLNRS
ncbi:MAG: hypothetical protein ABJZ55_01955 [Fuerstiella sp.]